MPDIAASDVTITVQFRERTSKRRRHRVKIAFGNGTLTYPSGGVPMPAAASFGMTRVLENLLFGDTNDGSGLLWKFNQEDKKLRGYEFDYPNAAEGPALELDAGVDAPAAQVLYAEAVGW